jgi:preprotein translocase SecE subunit
MAFQVYKKGQGRYVRMTTGVLLALLTLYGCSALSAALYESGSLPWSFMGQTYTYSQVVPILVFIAVIAGLVWLLNWPKFAEFLIETETEMGRVAWPSRASVTGSSIVVIVTVVIMSLVLFGIDQLLLFVLGLMKFYNR